MFEEYYKDKLIKKNEMNSKNHIINYKTQPNEEKMDLNKNKIFNENNKNINNNNYEKENKKNILHRPLSGINKEIIKKNFEANNRYIISRIQKANNLNKLKKNNSKENLYHKEFGKTPKYIKNMKIEADRKKEIEKLKNETANYPKGTRLLSEEERLLTLEKLKQSKDNINQVIEKLPITCDSQAFKNKKEELFKKLDEIEKAIETFSKKKVFIQVENS